MSKETLENEIKELENSLVEKQKSLAKKKEDLIEAIEKEQNMNIENANEVVKAWLEDADYEDKEQLNYDYGSDSFDFQGFTFKREEVYGGCEGAGEEHWIVFSVSKDGETKYFQVDGWYQSYNGAELEWNGFYEVHPAKETITVWKKDS